MRRHKEMYHSPPVLTLTSDDDEEEEEEKEKKAEINVKIEGTSNTGYWIH